MGLAGLQARLTKLERQRRTQSNLDAMRTWGRYVTPPEQPSLTSDDLPDDASAGQRRTLQLCRAMDARTAADPDAVLV